MDEIEDYFFCDDCQGKDFRVIYRFSLRFHNVNFSDELIYDRHTEEVYQCNHCGKLFTKKQVDEGLDRLKKRRRRKQ